MRRWRAALAAALAAFALAAPLTSTAVTVGPAYSHGRFDDVLVLRPEGAPTQVVLMLSDVDGWSAEDRQRAERFAHEGALVAGIDLPRMRQRFGNDACLFPEGDLENLSHHLQAFLKLPTYMKPVLAGRGQGATLAYAVMAQETGEGFGGLITWGFCPRLDGPQALCRGDGVHFRRLPAPKGRVATATRPPPAAPPTVRASAPAAAPAAASTASAPPRPLPAPDGIELLPAERLGVPWYVQGPSGSAGGACTTAVADAFTSKLPQARAMPTPAGDDHRIAQVMAQLRTQNRPEQPPPPSSLSGLPLIEVAAPSTAPVTKRMAVLLSGDGGWAEIDKAIAATMAKAGVPVVGFDSLRYFWSKRTPQELARDLDRIMRFYADRWKREDVVLIGFSQGADVLPFAINRLPTASRALLHYTALLGLAPKASFEFHLSNWLGPSGTELVAPEAQKLRARETLCLHGSLEKASLCPELPASAVSAVQVPGDHHFGGKFDDVARLILQRSENP